MREDLAIVLVAIAVALFFAPALLLGPVYFAFAFLYLVSLYLAERWGPRWLSEAVSILFALVLAHLMMERLGRWDWRLFTIFTVLVTVSAIRRLKNEGSSNPDAR
ncbi:hypothetical protein E3E26_07975 [Thermococcus sp. LS1]|nr:hypothetical protein [Thermococcus sp. LS1]